MKAYQKLVDLYDPSNKSDPSGNPDILIYKYLWDNKDSLISGKLLSEFTPKVNVNKDSVKGADSRNTSLEQQVNALNHLIPTSCKYWN